MNIQWAVYIPGARVKGLDVAADFQRPTAGNYPDNNSITDKYQYLVSLFSKVTANLTMRVKVKLQLSI